MQYRPSPTSTPHGWPTVRRFPRTMGEAFGGVDNACAIECYRRTSSTLTRACGWFAAGVGLVILAFAIGG